MINYLKKGAKNILIKGVDDKCSHFCFQLQWRIFTNPANLCRENQTKSAQVFFTTFFLVRFTENHWSNTENSVEFFKEINSLLGRHQTAPTWVEFLFGVLLGIGALFWVGTAHGISTLYNIQKLARQDTKIWEHMFAKNNIEPANNVFRNIYTKRKNRRKFLLCITLLGSQKCSDWFKLHRIAENFYSV